MQVNKQKIMDEMKSISTQSTHNKTFSFNSTNKDRESIPPIINTRQININNKQEDKSKAKVKDKLLQSAQLFQLPGTNTTITTNTTNSNSKDNYN